MKNNEWSGIAKGIILGVILVAGVTALAAWNEPTQNPTGGNPEPPINTSNTGQIKGGNLTVNANNQAANGLLVPFGNVLIGATNFPAGLKLNVDSGVGATKFCENTNGGKCFTVADLCAKVANLCQ
ncbi:MAG TPA: hypothetical protein VJG48_00360 [Candidatus Paceibacterota bacterium]